MNNESTVQRTRQNEPQRRSRSGEQKNSKKNKRAGNDALMKLICLQVIIVIAALASVFVMGRISPSSYGNLKKQYDGIMSEDKSLSQIFSGMKEYALLVLSYMDEEEETQTVSTQILSEVTTVSQQSLEEISTQTGETVASAEIESAKSAGGKDIDIEKAAKGTSFADYVISEAPAMPVNSRNVTSEFGYRTNPISGNYGFHTGLDIAAAQGTKISCLFFGIVEEVGEDDKWGKYVRVKHSDSLETFYCHCSEVFVKNGDVIRKGETLALVGSTGWSTGPHLHIEIIIDSVRVDPYKLLFEDKSA